MMKPDPAPQPARDVVVVSATDNGYAMPLAVTIRSALERLGADRKMRLFILDGGLSDEIKGRLLTSLSDPRLSIEWLRPDVELVRDLPTSAHLTAAAYLRLLMPVLLPPEVTRVIYLDADLLVRRDLGQLWDEDQGGHAVLATQDAGAPCLDAAVMLPSFQRCRRYLAAATPVANYRELGLPTDGKYFNSGVLVMDVAQWRREDYAQQVLDCLREHRRHVLWCDQYALNVVLARKWRALDRRWNQGAHVYSYPSWRDSPFDRETFALLRSDPWIVHFCSPSKPWQYFCAHPFTREFRRYLDETAWSGWRPPRPENFLQQWCQFHYQPLRHKVKSHVRTLKYAVGRKRRRAA